eukprot:744353-Rhodomonas_salina.3
MGCGMCGTGCAVLYVLRYWMCGTGCVVLYMRRYWMSSLTQACAACGTPGAAQLHDSRLPQ